jgi:hypothetical protein
MCSGCQNNECQGCGEVINSGQIPFDGSFTNIPIPANSDINDVLLLMESYFNNLTIQEQTYTVATENCLELTAGVYSFVEIISALITAICGINTTIGEDVTTNDVLLEDVTVPSCLLPFTGTTTTALFNHIMTFVCGLAARTRPAVNVLDDNSDGFVVDTTSQYTDVVAVKTHESLADNPTYVFNHTTPTYSGASLNVTVNPISAMYENQLIVRNDSKLVALDSTKDNYIFLVSDGLIEKMSVTVGASAPTKASSILLYKMTTNGSGVTVYEEEFVDSAFNDPSFTLADDAVTTAKILNGAVTSAKMDDIVAPTTKGHVALLTVTVNAKGQVTAINSNIDLTGIADGDILIYDNGSGGFVVGQRRNVTASGTIPYSNGTDYLGSSLKEESNKVTVGKPLQVNNATAIEASALTLDDGLLVYVTSTNGTFTSVGFWGVVNGAWVKL